MYIWSRAECVFAIQMLKNENIFPLAISRPQIAQRITTVLFLKSFKCEYKYNNISIVLMPLLFLLPWSLEFLMGLIQSVIPICLVFLPGGGGGHLCPQLTRMCEYESDGHGSVFGTK